MSLITPTEGQVLRLAAAACAQKTKNHQPNEWKAADGMRQNSPKRIQSEPETSTNASMSVSLGQVFRCRSGSGLQHRLQRAGLRQSVEIRREEGGRASTRDNLRQIEGGSGQGMEGSSSSHWEDSVENHVEWKNK